MSFPVRIIPAIPIIKECRAPLKRSIPAGIPRGRVPDEATLEPAKEVRAMQSILSRRAFLRGAAAAAGVAGAAGVLPSAGAPLSPKTAAPSPPKGGGSPEDEAYWKVVRRCFLLDPTITHMNNGTLGPMPASVLRGVTERMTWLARDPNCYHSPGARNIYALVESARKKIAAFTGVSPEEVAFTRNTTEAMNIVAHGIRMEKGDELLTTDHEHGGGLGCWEKKALREGIVLKKVKLPVPPENKEQILERFEAALTPRTRVISVSHVTCTTGMRLPVKEICRMAHERDIWVCVDGAQTVGWLPLDLRDSPIDLLSLSGHKLHACKGVGALFVRRGTRLRPLIVGGHQERGRRGGTEAVPNIVALGKAAELAAYFSKMRNAGMVSVHYCRAKDVHKPRGAKAGTVTIKNTHKIKVKPQLLENND